MKSILFKIWKFPELSETFVVNQIVTAIKLGYNVKILVGEINEIAENANYGLFEDFNLKNKIIIEDYDMPGNKFKRLLKAILLIFLNIRFLNQLIRYYKCRKVRNLTPLFEFLFFKKIGEFDIFHIQFGTNKHPVEFLKKTGYLKSQIITSFHGHDLHFPINGIIQPKGYYDLLFEISEYLICNTPFLKEKLIALNAPQEKIRVVPVAVDTNFFKPVTFKKGSSKTKLITVGRLDELKGQIFGIRAVSHLMKKGHEIEYIIAGTGPYEKKLKKLVADFELNQQVFFKGRVSQSEVCLLLQSSDIFLMPSVTNRQGMQESQGLVTAEAQAVGLPVVAFNTGGIKFTLVNKETGFLCKEKNVNEFADKIELLINEPNLRLKMGKNALKYIEREYSEKAVMKLWQKIYN